MKIIRWIKDKIATQRKKKYQPILDEIDQEIERCKAYLEINKKMIELTRKHNSEKAQWLDKIEQICHKAKGIEQKGKIITNIPVAYYKLTFTNEKDAKLFTELWYKAQRTIYQRGQNE